jgi:hypothetical protein
MTALVIYFEFANLKSDVYLPVTAFGYTNTSKQTEETDRVSVNGTYQGNVVYTSVFSYSSNPTANIQKVVIIKKKMKE